MITIKSSTLILKIVICFVGAIALGLLIMILPSVLNAASQEYYPHFIVLYLSTIPFYFALYQTLKLLVYVDKNKAFSNSSLQALRYIKYCAIAFGVMYTIIIPYVYYRGDIDDAPGPIAIGLIFIATSFVIAAIAAVLQKLIQNAVELKSENDLTV